MRRSWFCALSVALCLVAPPGYAKECPSHENLPPGVRMPEQAGCRARPPEPSRPKVRAPAKNSHESGFIDLGNGAELRIGGQVDFEAGARRR
jgi:hypothetical protein